MRSRTTWFLTGTLIGVLGALGLMWYVARTQVRAAQTHVVAADGSAPYLRIAEGMAVAQPGDVVRVEPGEYMEQVVVADGVDLVARVPGSVTVSRPLDLDPSMAGLTAGGAQPARVSGIRLTSAVPSPGMTAINIAGAGATLELLEIAGPHARAFALAPGASLTMKGSRVGVNGALVSVPDGAQVTFANSIFVRSAPSTDAPIVAGPTSRLTLTGNVFAGFSPEIVRGLSAARRDELLKGNTIVAPPTPPRRAAGRRP